MKPSIKNPDDQTLRHLQKRAWEKGVPLDEYLRTLLNEIARRKSAPREKLSSAA